MHDTHLHRRMMERTLSWTRELAVRTRVTLELRLDRIPPERLATLHRRPSQGAWPPAASSPKARGTIEFRTVYEWIDADHFTYTSFMNDGKGEFKNMVINWKRE